MGVGINMPVDALIQATEAIGADYVVLGTAKVSTEYGEQDLNTYFTEVLSKLQPNQKLIVGGNGTFNIDHFQRNQKFQFLSSLQHFDDLIKDL